MMKKILLTILILINLYFQAKTQYSTLNAHSHNDYENDPPLWLACNNHFGSVEADIWAVRGELFVAHYEREMKPERTLDSLYIQPIVRMFRENRGRAWKDKTGTFQFLIDLKTRVEPTLSLVIEKLKLYPDVFDPEINENAVRVVITGNRPDPSEFSNYPGFIFFDGLLNTKYDTDQLARIPMFSENFRSFSSWNGTGEIIGKEMIRLENTIDSVHSLHKKIRFWNSPDDINAWNTFMRMGIDYINTDKIIKLAEYLNTKGYK